MRALTLWQMEQIPWWIFAAYWAVTWLRVKRTKERERSRDRLITLLVGGLAFALLFGNWLLIGPLRQRFQSSAICRGVNQIRDTCSMRLPPDPERLEGVALIG